MRPAHPSSSSLVRPCSFRTPFRGSFLLSRAPRSARLLHVTHPGPSRRPAGQHRQAPLPHPPPSPPAPAAAAPRLGRGQRNRSSLHASSPPPLHSPTAPATTATAPSATTRAASTCSLALSS